MSLKSLKAGMNHLEAAADAVTQLRASALELAPTEPIDIRALITMQDGAQGAR
jgi:hypothetical protein